MINATPPNADSDRQRGVKAGAHHQRLNRLRDIERQRRGTIFAFSIIGILLVAVAAVAAIDYFYELSVPARVAGWCAVVFAVATFVMLRRRWISFDSRDAVHEAERVWPTLGQRLRTSHDYQQHPDNVAPADAELLQALESETQQQVSQNATEPLGRPWPLFGLLGAVGLAGLLWLSALIGWHEWRIATGRMLFAPMHYSQIEMEPLPEQLHLGDDLTVRMHVEGRPIESARLLYRVADSEPSGAGQRDAVETDAVEEDATGSSPDGWKEISLTSNVDGVLVDELTAVLSECQNDLEVQVEAGHFRSDVQKISVRLPLVLEEWTAEVQPPAYTGLPSDDGHPDTLRIPEGSQLNLHATYNRKPKQVDVDVTPLDDVETASGLEDSVANVSLQAAGEPMDVQLTATASDGMVDDSSLHLDLIPDRTPRLKFAAPSVDSEAIATAELRFTLEAVDDYGLNSVGIRYRVDDGPEQTLWESETVDDGNAMAKTVTLALEELELSYPQAITYYAFAVDNREPKTQRTTSDLRFVDIRPFSREYEFKEGDCKQCQGECLTLETLIKEQRSILSRTFVANQNEKATTGMGARLADDEDELREKTTALTEALEAKVGPMPSLVFATRSMGEAIDDLRADALPDGQVDEESALAYLVDARRNLRKILKQGSSQAKMCRNVDQQQMDKIRKPEREEPKKKADQENQLAELREKLEKLAERQESFCESAKACMQPGSNAGQSQAGAKPESPPSPSPEELAKQQAAAAQEARELQRELSDGRFGELAPERLEEAAEAIESSGVKIAKEETTPESIDHAQQAAETIQRLSDHLGRRHDPDFADKLAVATRLAQTLSEEQRELAQSWPKSGPATDAKSGLAAQRLLADGAEELAELVDQLQAESSQQSWEVQQGLIESADTNSPRSASAQMRRASEAVESEQWRPATESGLRASDTLRRLAEGLKEVQQATGDKRLEDLKQAEQRAASLLKELARARGAAAKAMARSETQQFAEQLGPLARSDSELSTASRRLNNPVSGSDSNVKYSDAQEGSRLTPQLSSSETRLIEGLREVDEILQRRIQEAILSGTLQQAVGAVPPQYSEMVDEYYRKLSEDVE